MILLKGKTYWITGATGRLGTEISSRLEELGAEVVPLVLPGHYRNPKRVRWMAKSSPIIVKNDRDLASLSKPDRVINFHWLVNRNLSFSEQLLYEFKMNINNNAFLWNWVKDKPIESFLHISSIKIYSHLNQNPISNITEPRPVTAYGLMKFFSEKFFNAIFQNSTFRLSHLRLGSIASFGENPAQLMTKLFNSAFNNKYIKISINHKTHLIYIDDITDLIINASIVNKERSYNLISEGWLNEEIAKAFERISGRVLKVDYIDLYPGQGDLTIVSDVDKLKSDWIRETSLESMIRKIINQYLHKLNSKFP